MNPVMVAIRSCGKLLAVRIIGSRSNRRFAWARWAQVRVMAIRGLQPVFRGVHIEWDVPGHGWAVPVETPGPSSGEVLIRTVASAVSLGTERAFYSLEPNTGVRFPYHPGYSLAGEVWQVGAGVKHLHRGQLVATQAPHASLVVVPFGAVFPLPEGVAPEEGAFIYLGIIALHGIWRGELQTRERAAVLERGPIGQLTVQLAHALGASQVISIAPSRRHYTPILERFASRVVSTDEEGEEVLDSVQADVTYESSGDPRAVLNAVRATRNGGRVVLLGSSRGATLGFDFGELAARDITLLGAHISALPRDMGASAHNYREAGEIFLHLVAEEAVAVSALVNIEVNPWEVGKFYRQLAQDRPNWVGALLRWDQLQETDRLQRVSYWTKPELEMVNRTRMSRLPRSKSLLAVKASRFRGSR